MKYGTLFSGIGAPEQAFKDFGWEHQFMAEIEKFPSAVLKYHFPNIPNLGDVTKVDWDEIRRTRPVDLLVFGSPCQSFSIAGKRAGLDDPRGNLAIYALSVVNKLRPSCFLFENVPGLLSSDGGRDFGIFLKTVGECGYGCAWRILDAQYFGVPQRRRRVFVVGYLGDWRRAVQVLFERESLSGNPAPGRKTGQGFTHDVSPNIGASGRGFDRAGETRGQDPVVAFGGNKTSGSTATATACNAKGGSGRMDFESETLIVHQLQGRYDSSEDGTGRGVPLVCDMRGNGDGNIVPTLTGDYASRPTDYTPIVFQYKAGGRTGLGMKGSGEIPPPVLAGNQAAIAFVQKQSGDVLTSDKIEAMGTNQNATGRNTPKVVLPARVRRLTPRECERLQGFPDDYTSIPYGKKPAADGPRYKALGNSMAVPVVRWIGERIQKVMEIK